MTTEEPTDKPERSKDDFIASLRVITAKLESNQRESDATMAAFAASPFAALLKDRQSLDRALADPERFPRVPPGMPIGEDDE